MLSLPEAIRKGGQYHRQGRGTYFSKSMNTTCAVGGAIVASLTDEERLKVTDTYLDKRMDIFTSLGLHRTDFKSGCDLCPEFTVTFLHHLVVHLNDNHGMSRLEIGDIVERIIESKTKNKELCYV